MASRLLGLVAGRIRRKVSKSAGSSPRHLIPRPLRFLLLAVVIRLALSNTNLPLLAREFWSGASTVIAILGSVWLLIEINAAFVGFLSRRLFRRNQAAATSTLLLTRRAVDFLIVSAGLLVGLYHFGVNPATTLAGLGVGSIAIALAAQKTLENIIGGISVISDRTLRVGDTVKAGENTGFVELIGLRSTRIRTPQRTVVSIPNGQLSTVSLENLSIRDKFWFHHTVSLQRQTLASAMRAILDGIENLLTQHPSVETNSVRVRFVAFGTSSLDIELYAYVAAGDYAHFLQTQQDLLLNVMDIVQKAGASLAYPSQTLYLNRSNAAGAREEIPEH